MSPYLGERQTYGKSIRKDDGYATGGYTYYPVVILGAGASGIAMGCRLKEALACDQFRIIERQSGIGGTWWINRYPGAACDVPAVFYSFSFCPNTKWTSLHPEGLEIVKYLQDVCVQYQIVDKIQLNTDVRECRWIESDQVWELTVQHLVSGAGDLSEHDRARKLREQGPESVYAHQEVIRAKVVVSAVGGLVEPNLWPENIPGYNEFAGQIFHSARWRQDVDLHGKNVIVLGTGCSAAQFVPRLTKEYGAKSVTQIMRSPPWVVPRLVPPFGEDNWKKWAPWVNTNIPGFNRTLRTLLFFYLEYDWRLFGSEAYHERERRKVEAECLRHMQKTVPKKYHEILTPNYGFACKRKILDAAWFPGMNDPAFDLTTMPLTRVAEHTVILGPGRMYPDVKDATSPACTNQVTLPADVIILANGFQTTKFLHPLDITGRGGKKLHDVFNERGGPQMYMGTALDGFPNLFALYGPNTVTGHTSVIFTSESTINLCLKLIKPILDEDVVSVEIRKEAEIKWARDTQQAAKRRVWNTGGCVNWYQTEEGWNSTTYPYSQIWYRLCCMFPTWSDWNISYSRKGALKKRAKVLLGYFVLFTAITGLAALGRHGQNWAGVTALLKKFVRSVLLTGGSIMQKAGESLST